MKRKRISQEGDVNVRDFKKIKTISSFQQCTDIKSKGQRKNRDKKRKKMKLGDNESYNDVKLCKEKLPKRKNISCNPSINNIEAKQKHSEARSPLKQKASKEKIVNPDRIDELKDNASKPTKNKENSISKENSEVGKKSGKKLNKWQRFKAKKTKGKNAKVKGHTEIQNKQENGETSTEVSVNSVEVSSNWKKLQQDLGLNAKKKKVKLVNAKEKETKDKEKEPEIWFDDVDEILLDRKTKLPEKCTRTHNPLVKAGSYGGLTKILAMDCEMVGVGRDGRESMLARVSIVNQHGHCVYDEFVKPMEDVVDYRTKVSGIRKQDLEKGKEFPVVQRDISSMIKGRLLVGHAIHHDLQVLYISHPKKQIRDTSRYKYFHQLYNGRTPSLKNLSSRVLGVSVQEGEHSSVQDAQATMRLYTMYRKQWEKEIKGKTKPVRQKKSQKQREINEGKLEKINTKKDKVGKIIPTSLLEDN
ncbi:uncharacterized protein LOC133187887 [Saccostrea echinata]|uniref:uncharacterized protein LOC133187887 n=1 Tax=Saccostrea echinata TaxID=191078 RepID=UPI002A7EFDAC|nr:uncharacterized protein LOC133187887 [Saccostrea echinata]